MKAWQQLVMAAAAGGAVVITVQVIQPERPGFAPPPAAVPQVMQPDPTVIVVVPPAPEPKPEPPMIRHEPRIPRVPFGAYQVGK